jgi:hypothetical protein
LPPSTSQTRCRLSLNTMRRPLPEPAGNVVSLVGDPCSSVASADPVFAVTFAGALGASASGRGVDETFVAAAAGSADGSAAVITPVPPSTAIAVTAREDASMAIRP